MIPVRRSLAALALLLAAPAAGQLPPIDVRIDVVPPGAGADKLALAVRRVELSFPDGRSTATVAEGARLGARATFAYTGVGPLSGRWLVDGRVVGDFTATLTFGRAHEVTLSDVPGLPTFEPGEHTVTLQLLTPLVGLPVPVIRYIVALAPPGAGAITLVAPAEGAAVARVAAAVATHLGEHPAAGDTAAGIAFSWLQAGVPAPRYQVEVRDAGGAGPVVAAGLVPGPRWTPSPTQARALVVGATYGWSVTALAPGGSPLTVSRVGKFKVRAGKDIELVDPTEGASVPRTTRVTWYATREFDAFEVRLYRNAASLEADLAALLPPRGGGGDPLRPGGAPPSTTTPAPAGAAPLLVVTAPRGAREATATLPAETFPPGMAVRLVVVGRDRSAGRVEASDPVGVLVEPPRATVAGLPSLLGIAGMDVEVAAYEPGADPGRLAGRGVVRFRKDRRAAGLPVKFDGLAADVYVERRRTRTGEGLGQTIIVTETLRGDVTSGAIEARYAQAVELDLGACTGEVDGLTLSAGPAIPAGAWADLRLRLPAYTRVVGGGRAAVALPRTRLEAGGDFYREVLPSDVPPFALAASSTGPVAVGSPGLLVADYSSARDWVPAAGAPVRAESAAFLTGAGATLPGSALFPVLEETDVLLEDGVVHLEAGLRATFRVAASGALRPVTPGDHEVRLSGGVIALVAGALDPMLLRLEGTVRLPDRVRAELGAAVVATFRGMTVSGGWLAGALDAFDLQWEGVAPADAGGDAGGVRSGKGDRVRFGAAAPSDPAPAASSVRAATFRLRAARGTLRLPYGGPPQDAAAAGTSLDAGWLESPFVARPGGAGAVVPPADRVELRVSVTGVTGTIASAAPTSTPPASAGAGGGAGSSVSPAIDATRSETADRMGGGVAAPANTPAGGVPPALSATLAAVPASPPAGGEPAIETTRFPAAEGIGSGVAAPVNTPASGATPGGALVEAVAASAPLDRVAKLGDFDASVTAFRIAVADGAVTSSELEGRLVLPRPADVKIPFDGARLGADGEWMGATLQLPAELELAFWRVRVKPERHVLSRSYLSLEGGTLRLAVTAEFGGDEVSTLALSSLELGADGGVRSARVGTSPALFLRFPISLESEEVTFAEYNGADATPSQELVTLQARGSFLFGEKRLVIKHTPSGAAVTFPNPQWDTRSGDKVYARGLLSYLNGYLHGQPVKEIAGLMTSSFLDAIVLNGIGALGADEAGPYMRFSVGTTVDPGRCFLLWWGGWVPIVAELGAGAIAMASGGEPHVTQVAQLIGDVLGLAKGKADRKKILETVAHAMSLAKTIHLDAGGWKSHPVYTALDVGEVLIGSAAAYGGTISAADAKKIALAVLKGLELALPLLERSDLFKDQPDAIMVLRFLKVATQITQLALEKGALTSRDWARVTRDVLELVAPAIQEPAPRLAVSVVMAVLAVLADTGGEDVLLTVARSASSVLQVAQAANVFSGPDARNVVAIARALLGALEAARGAPAKEATLLIAKTALGAAAGPEVSYGARDRTVKATLRIAIGGLDVLAANVAGIPARDAARMVQKALVEASGAADVALSPPPAGALGPVARLVDLWTRLDARPVAETSADLERMACELGGEGACGGVQLAGVNAAIASAQAAPRLAAFLAAAAALAAHVNKASLPGADPAVASKIRDRLREAGPDLLQAAKTLLAFGTLPSIASAPAAAARGRCDEASRLLKLVLKPLDLPESSKWIDEVSTPVCDAYKVRVQALVPELVARAAAARTPVAALEAWREWSADFAPALGRDPPPEVMRTFEATAASLAAGCRSDLQLPMTVPAAAQRAAACLDALLVLPGGEGSVPPLLASLVATSFRFQVDVVARAGAGALGAWDAVEGYGPLGLLAQNDARDALLLLAGAGTGAAKLPLLDETLAALTTMDVPPVSAVIGGAFLHWALLVLQATPAHAPEGAAEKQAALAAALAPHVERAKTALLARLDPGQVSHGGAVLIASGLRLLMGVPGQAGTGLESRWRGWRDDLGRLPCASRPARIEWLLAFAAGNGSADAAAGVGEAVCATELADQTVEAGLAAGAADQIRAELARLRATSLGEQDVRELLAWFIAARVETLAAGREGSGPEAAVLRLVHAQVKLVNTYRRHSRAERIAETGKALQGVTRELFPNEKWLAELVGGVAGGLELFARAGGDTLTPAQQVVAFAAAVLVSGSAGTDTERMVVGALVGLMKDPTKASAGSARSSPSPLDAFATASLAASVVMGIVKANAGRLPPFQPGQPLAPPRTFLSATVSGVVGAGAPEETQDPWGSFFASVGSKAQRASAWVSGAIEYVTPVAIEVIALAKDINAVVNAKPPKERVDAIAAMLDRVSKLQKLARWGKILLKPAESLRPPDTEQADVGTNTLLALLGVAHDAIDAERPAESTCPDLTKGIAGMIGSVAAPDVNTPNENLLCVVDLARKVLRGDLEDRPAPGTLASLEGLAQDARTQLMAQAMFQQAGGANARLSGLSGGVEFRPNMLSAEIYSNAEFPFFLELTTLLQWDAYQGRLRAGLAAADPRPPDLMEKLGMRTKVNELAGLSFFQNPIKVFTVDISRDRGAFRIALNLSTPISGGWDTAEMMGDVLWNPFEFDLTFQRNASTLAFLTERESARLYNKGGKSGFELALQIFAAPDPLPVFDVAPFAELGVAAALGGGGPTLTIQAAGTAQFGLYASSNSEEECIGQPLSTIVTLRGAQFLPAGSFGTRTGRGACRLGFGTSFDLGMGADGQSLYVKGRGSVRLGATDLALWLYRSATTAELGLGAFPADRYGGWTGASTTEFTLGARP